MIAMPVEADPTIRIAAIKLALALFYRHKGFPAEREYWVSSYWTQSADRKTLEKWSVLVDDLRGLEIGNRPNVNLGSRFRYRWAIEDEGHFDIFMAIAQFGDGLTVCVIVSEEALWEDVEDAKP